MAGKIQLINSIAILENALKKNISIIKSAKDLNLNDKSPRNIRSHFSNKNDLDYKKFLELYDKVVKRGVVSSVGGNVSLESPVEVKEQLDREDADLLDKDDVVDEEQFEVTQEWRNKQIDYRGNKIIKTLEELISESKTDLEIWKIDRHIINKWDTTIGNFGDAYISQNFQVKAFLSVREEAVQAFNAVEKYKELIAEYQPVETKAIEYSKKTESNLLEVSIYDLHIGKLCWAGETGENYDVKIAQKRFIEAIEKLIARATAFDFERILFVVGNDFFNVDTIWNETTEGTKQDEDLRWQKTFRLGHQLLINGIDYMKQFAPVDVKVIPGNHDFTRSFYLGETLSAWYRLDDHVTVDNEANPRKYYHYGEVLIGLTHGNNEKEINLGLTMAHEAKEMWSETSFHEWHLGHFHKKKAVKYTILDENVGITVRYLSSLSGKDSWHHKKGYIGSNKAAEAFLWNAETGLIGQFNVNLNPIEEKD